MDEWNSYPFQCYDGDNWPSDNEECRALVEQLLVRANQLGYGEIRPHRHSYGSTLMGAFEKLANPKFQSVTITDKADVYPALRKFFTSEEGSERPSV